MGNPWPDGESSLSDGGPGSQLTPMGEVDSMRMFALGLGPRRVKIALAALRTRIVKKLNDLSA